MIVELLTRRLFDSWSSRSANVWVRVEVDHRNNKFENRKNEKKSLPCLFLICSLHQCSEMIDICSADSVL